MGFFKNIGDAITDTGNILNSITSKIPGEGPSQFKSISEAYGDASDAKYTLRTFIEDKNHEITGHVDKIGPVAGTASIFNPFRVFRYSGFGWKAADYKWEFHLDNHWKEEKKNIVAEVVEKVTTIVGGNGTISEAAKKAGSFVSKGAGEFQAFEDVKKLYQNPTASEIIRWSQANAKKMRHGFGSPVPYTAADFLWCKYYGKVPNNRLVTLRRYPIPVEDNIHIAKLKSPMVPIAQAVTWFGNDIGNDINKILPLNWGMKWENRNSSVQDINGNEISVDDILELYKGSIPNKGKVREALIKYVLSGNDTVDMLKLSGFDKKLNQYIKNSYADNGPYWNRILGPINVIDSTKIRSRGFPPQSEISLSFEYSLRAYGGANPKIAFLDLLSNILSLTYNTAPFWGGGMRYFEETGVTIPGLSAESLFARADYGRGIQQGIEQLTTLATANAQNLVNFAKAIAEGKYNNKTTEGKTEPNQDKIDEQKGILENDFENNYKEVGPLTKYVVSKMEPVLKKPLIYRSFLDGRSVGEWHITVGNPMNPIAMMGNLCLKTVKMEVGETLGIDDFPTEFKFDITFEHGRPRAKQDIESIFNLGINTGMGFTRLSQPSSASNSYGERTTYIMESFQNPDGIQMGESGNTGQGTSKAQTSEGYDNTKNINASATAGYAFGATRVDDKKTTDQLSETFRRRVGEMYGTGFGSSPILLDYFKEIKTKD